MMDLVRDEEKKKVLAFVLSYLIYIRPFVAPPGIPAERLKALAGCICGNAAGP